MDIEWAIDGLSHELYIVQARPRDHSFQEQTDSIKEYEIEDEDQLADKLILEGVAVGDKNWDWKGPSYLFFGWKGWQCR